jgi:hypothetical protein
MLVTLNYLKDGIWTMICKFEQTLLQNYFLIVGGIKNKKKYCKMFDVIVQYHLDASGQQA